MKTTWKDSTGASFSVHLPDVIGINAIPGVPNGDGDVIEVRLSSGDPLILAFSDTNAMNAYYRRMLSEWWDVPSRFDHAMSTFASLAAGVLVDMGLMDDMEASDTPQEVEAEIVDDSESEGQE